MRNHIVISPHPKYIVEKSIPKEWKEEGNYCIVTSPEFLEMDYDVELDAVYPWGDIAFDTICEKIDRPDKGFSKSVSELCNNKYTCRKTLKSLDDIPFEICKDNVVNWPGDKDEKLIAKPVNGTGSRGISIVKHGDQLEAIDQDYIIEKYIDDKYPRMCVDGYLCNGEIGILCLWDNNYKKDDPTRFESLAYPCRLSDTVQFKAIRKFRQAVKELHDLTGTDNQIFDIEFFIIDGEAKIMEINPRIGGNYLPFFERVTGYNPWKCYENIRNGKLPEKVSLGGCGVCRYNWFFDCEDSIYEDKKGNYSVKSAQYSHTYMFSSKRNISYKELLKKAKKVYKRFKYKSLDCKSKSNSKSNGNSNGSSNDGSSQNSSD